MHNVRLQRSVTKTIFSEMARNVLPRHFPTTVYYETQTFFTETTAIFVTFSHSIQRLESRLRSDTRHVIYIDLRISSIIWFRPYRRWCSAENSGSLLSGYDIGRLRTDSPGREVCVHTRNPSFLLQSTYAYILREALSVRLSLCPSHSSTVSKRSSNFLSRLDSPSI